VHWERRGRIGFQAAQWDCVLASVGQGRLPCKVSAEGTCVVNQARPVPYLHALQEKGGLGLPLHLPNAAAPLSPSWINVLALMDRAQLLMQARSGAGLG